MRYLPENDLIVIVGGWNPNILQDPNWVRKYLFDKTISEAGSDGDETVVRTNKIEVDDVRLTMNAPKLGLGLIVYSDEGLGRVQKVAFNVCDFLPHTPVHAFGINFAYETAVIKDAFTRSPDILKLESNMEHPPSQRKMVLTWQLDQYILNVSLHWLTDETMRWDFHYHHKIASLDDFKGIVEERNLLEYRQDSLNFVDSLVAVGKG